MKYILLIITILLSAFLPARAETLKFEADPICVAAHLAEQNDSISIAKIFEHYGYRHQPSQDGYTVFTTPNGDLIRFVVSDGTDGRKTPTIEVKTKVTPKERDRILESLKYKKQGNIYERRIIGSIIHCSPVSGGFLRFSTNKEGTNP